MSYTKLANTIVTSTIWMESDPTRITWFTMMALANKDGEVLASIPGLANIARVSVEACRAAIEIFLSPDPDSRTKDDQGRRIQEIEGGWLLLNHSKYRQLASDDDRRVKAAERQKRKRERDARNKRHAPVTPESHQISQAEAEAKAEAKAREEAKPLLSNLVLTSPSVPVPPVLDPIQVRVGRLFRRKPTTKWNPKELKAWKALGSVSEEEIRLIETYYTAEISRDKDYRRRDLGTLLNNWAGECDRARNFKQPESYTNPL